MKFKRGFKRDCELTADALRDELGLAVDRPIDMRILANHLEIPVQPWSDYLRIVKALRGDIYIEETYKKVSAFTVFEGSRRTIVFNDDHGRARHRSDLAHELAHALLHHPPLGSGISVEQEELHEGEAAWMGGVLMLTALQARLIARARLPSETIMEAYEVSREMLRFRLNVTGAARVSRPPEHLGA